MPPGASPCSRRPARPSVKTAGCSTSQSSSGVCAERDALNACIARHVASYATSPRLRTFIPRLAASSGDGARLPEPGLEVLIEGVHAPEHGARLAVADRLAIERR